jgi:cyclophilin family peptidyl-prolyl cis-trans isomerase
MNHRNRNSLRPAAIRRAIADVLEPRRLFAATVVQQIPNTVGDVNGTATTFDLQPFLNDPATAVTRFTTSLGDVRFRLYESQKPLTVTNFLNYVTQNRYNSTFVHRSDTLDPSDAITNPAEILQAGGYAYPGFAHIPTDAPIRNEYETNGVLQNTRGTIAMAKTSDPNSATSEFFINVRDTSYALNNTANSGGFTVFGNVFADDLDVVDAIAAVQQRGFASPFSNLPLRNYTDDDYNNSVVPTDNNLVMVTSAVQLPDVTYFVSSSDPSLVNPTINGTNLVLNYGATRGSAVITVTATDLDGNSVSNSFTAGVGQLDVTLGGTSGNRQLSYTDADGTVSTVSVKGPGEATVRVIGEGLATSVNRGRVTLAGTNLAIGSMAVVGSTAGTTISISSKGGDRITNVASLSADGPVRAISAKGVNITTGLTTVGAVGSLSLGSATGATISLGGTFADRGASISFAGDVTDTDLTVTSPVRSLKLRSVVDTGAAGDDLFTFLSLDSLSTSGDFAADIDTLPEGDIRSIKIGRDLTGDITAHKLGSLSVRGAMTGSTLTLEHGANEAVGSPDAKGEQALQSLKVGGAITNVIVNSAGTIGAVSASSITGSRFVAGAPALTTLPTSLGDLVQPASILSIRNRGVFANTIVAARSLGRLTVGTITTGNGGTAFGFGTDSIASLSGSTDGGQRFSIRNAGDQTVVDAALATVTKGDLVVQVF